MTVTSVNNTSLTKLLSKNNVHTYTFEKNELELQDDRDTTTDINPESTDFKNDKEHSIVLNVNLKLLTCELIKPLIERITNGIRYLCVYDADSGKLVTTVRDPDLHTLYPNQNFLTWLAQIHITSVTVKKQSDNVGHVDTNDIYQPVTEHNTRRGSKQKHIPSQTSTSRALLLISNTCYLEPDEYKKITPNLRIYHVLSQAMSNITKKINITQTAKEYEHEVNKSLNSDSLFKTFYTEMTREYATPVPAGLYDDFVKKSTWQDDFERLKIRMFVQKHKCNINIYNSNSIIDDYNCNCHAVTNTINLLSHDKHYYELSVMEDDNDISTSLPKQYFVYEHNSTTRRNVTVYLEKSHIHDTVAPVDDTEGQEVDEQNNTDERQDEGVQFEEIENDMEFTITINTNNFDGYISLYNTIQNALQNTIEFE